MQIQNANANTKTAIKFIRSPAPGPQNPPPSCCADVNSNSAKLKQVN